MKMILSLIILMFSITPVFAEEALTDRLTLIEQAEVEKMSPEELRQEWNRQSEKAADGGYVANRSVIPLFSAYSYRYTGGRYTDAAITFRLRLPPNMDRTKKYPMIISFHGAGESNDDNTRQLAHLQISLNFLAGPESLDCFVLVPHCPGDNQAWGISLETRDGKGDSPIECTKEIIDELLRVYPIDANRISCFGLCSGGRGCWEMAGRFPELFSGMVTCQLIANAGDATSQTINGMSLWLFNNVDDPSYPIKPIRELEQYLRLNNVSVCLTEGHGGHDSWTHALRDKRVMAWLASQERGRMSAPPGVVLLPKRTWSESIFHIFVPILLFFTFWLTWETLRVNSNIVQPQKKV